MTKRLRKEALKAEFNAAALLESHLRSPQRRHVKGITIDKAETRILDDGIFIARQDDGWVVEASIADLPAMIPDGDPLEFAARQMGYERDARERLFPYGFLLNYASLQHQEKRPAITFTIALDKDLNIISYGAERTVFENLKQCNDGDISRQLALQNPDIAMWVDLGQRLFARRMMDIAHIGDMRIANDNNCLPDNIPVHAHPGYEGEALVHEMMRLANIVATKIFCDHGLVAPFKNAAGVVHIIRASPDFTFDQECNRLALDIVSALAKDTAPYAHISSPMREYKDFLGLKILARHLDGLPPVDSDQDYAGKLSHEFNARIAAPARLDICSAEWRHHWEAQRQGQNIFMHQQIEQNPETPIGSLRQYCKGKGWKMPILTERKLLINGAQVTLAGLRCAGAGGETGWSVHHDAGGAVNLAAARLKREMNI